ncbi:hypothetical protein PanWU01x14_056750 [Parasponia andersonii]|uniref:Uncharacterized protein n=1 Tax=Parasponia andersonii TaxID=3476 RepID=A0A2P5DJN5_PARAD|nr:hypothetical protein PanWU01x14_056750 [Parasponia andersonii]
MANAAKSGLPYTRIIKTRYFRNSVSRPKFWDSGTIGISLELEIS